mgnify:CR=1 FL=1
MLFTNFFCNIKYTARTGKIKIKQAAFFVEYCGYVSYTPIASIKFSSSYIFTERGKFFDINIIGSKYSFQCQTIAKIETVEKTCAINPRRFLKFLRQALEKLDININDYSCPESNPEN